MQKVIFLSLLILCDILSQGTGIVTQDIHGKIDGRKAINITVDRIDKVPYVVNIHKNGEFICGGSIVESNIVISAAHCVEDRGIYVVYSGSIHLKRGKKHEVFKIEQHPGYHNKTFNDDIALLRIEPPINFSHSHTSTQNIPIYNNPESLMRPLNGIVSGWGCAGIKCSKFGCFAGVAYYPTILRSFQVVTIEQRICQRYYAGVTDKQICTLHASVERQYCSDGDSGGPLVVNNKLLGVLAWSGQNPEDRGPDVFMNLAHPEYHEWIQRTASRLRN